MKILDFTFFAIPLLLHARQLFRKRASDRNIVISQFEKDKEHGLRWSMKRGFYGFVQISLFSGYAFTRADLAYLWLVVGIFFLGLAAIMGFVLIHQHYANIELPTFPKTVSEKWIAKMVKERKTNRYIWLGVLVVWTYSWRSLFNL